VAIFAFAFVVAVTNFAIGFALAVHLGHGPHWADLSRFIRPKVAAKGSPRQSSAAKGKAH
jgi:hypothetical protein